ncbi:hypothetical protein [Sphingosinicella sp. BN140058]|uniref:hypothetical protein n=1 Tax=Sphingosinicella sp. BN140058 TaxID=1892855 RepID=UPI00101020CA|nr:hypothetical protein [Sphingosinicella sp. BN140058]QAY80428.1 hypothetical protein ETR14_27700 [Sphingosinicella sp. BN140058]
MFLDEKARRKGGPPALRQTIGASMPEPSYREIAAAARRLRCEFACGLTRAIGERVLDGSDAPIVISVSKPGLGLLETIRAAARLFQLQCLPTDVADAPDAAILEDTIAFLKRVRSDGSNDGVLIISDWHQDPRAAQEILRGLLDTRRPDQIIVVFGIDSDRRLASDVAAVLGDYCLRSDQTLIAVEAPDILDELAIRRLRARTD